jgi:hypothetical protein
MAKLIVQHRVQDYARWKPIFDEHGKYGKSTVRRGIRCI